ncbi:MAG TPA: nitrogenase iron protein NifH [Desulfitobacteriaceae bacterium]|jgi:nitrogenase iron protein NifH|nr:nitrogenase iron protein NifH [Desulfitobacteriaceae bacterium]
MLKIALYGKGGIGKSTTASNLSAAFAKKGFKVMQIGCDPKADSTRNLNGGQNVPTVLDVLRSKAAAITLKDIVTEGVDGILCVEAGGPTPGIGCAGRGIITAFDKLEELQAFEIYRPDIVLYDVLGDVVCGGFAMPIRGGYAEYVFIVTSGEKMSLYAASNIAAAIDNFTNRGYARLSGVILNSRNIKNEYRLVEDFAEAAKTRIIRMLSRSPDVQRAEDLASTVVGAFPDSPMTLEYYDLAERVLEECMAEADLGKQAGSKYGGVRHG